MAFSLDEYRDFFKRKEDKVRLEIEMKEKRTKDREEAKISVGLLRRPVLNGREIIATLTIVKQIVQITQRIVRCHDSRSCSAS